MVTSVSSAGDEDLMRTDSVNVRLDWMALAIGL